MKGCLLEAGMTVLWFSIPLRLTRFATALCGFQYWYAERQTTRGTETEMYAFADNVFYGVDWERTYESDMEAQTASAAPQKAA